MTMPLGKKEQVEDKKQWEDEKTEAEKNGEEDEKKKADEEEETRKQKAKEEKEQMSIHFPGGSVVATTKTKLWKTASSWKIRKGIKSGSILEQVAPPIKCKGVWMLPVQGGASKH